MHKFEFILNRYQTFLTGLMALVAAGVGVVAIRNQMDADERRSQSQRAAKTKAMTVAVDEFFDAVNRIEKIVSFRENNGVAKASIKILENEWIHLPKQVPPIIVDPYVMAEIPGAVVNDILMIRKICLVVQKCLDTLEPNFHNKDAFIETDRWNRFISGYTEHRRYYLIHRKAVFEIIHEFLPP